MYSFLIPSLFQFVKFGLFDKSNLLCPHHLGGTLFVNFAYVHEIDRCAIEKMDAFLEKGFSVMLQVKSFLSSPYTISGFQASSVCCIEAPGSRPSAMSTSFQIHNVPTGGEALGEVLGERLGRGLPPCLESARHQRV